MVRRTDRAAKRCGNQESIDRALAGLYPRLPHDLQAVTNRLDTGVGTAPQGISPHEEEQDAEDADAGEVVFQAGLDIADQRAAFIGMGEDSVDQHQNMAGDEGHEDRRHDRYGFLDAADVEDDQDHRQGAGYRDLVMMETLGDVTEDGIAAGGDRDGDGHHVVHQQGASRNDPGLLPQHVGGHDVAPAAVGEMLDDARIGVRDDEYRQRGGQAEKDRQVGVLSQSPEGLLGAVGR